MEEYALIVAGGTGNRMGTSVPKQFLPLLGVPVLAHTIRAFHNYSKSLKIIVVLPGNAISSWHKLSEQHGVEIPHLVVPGGDSRFASVKNGLAHIRSSEAVVAIHDGVRPLIDIDTIAKCMHTAATSGTAVVSVPLKESIRELGRKGSHAVDRSRFVLVQTPQAFRFSLLKQAYDIEYSPDLTDDATVVEKSGIQITLVQGSYDNIKITTPEDLVMAEKIMKMANKKAGSK